MQAVSSLLTALPSGNQGSLVALERIEAEGEAQHPFCQISAGLWLHWLHLSTMRRLSIFCFSKRAAARSKQQSLSADFKAILGHDKQVEAFAPFFPFFGHINIAYLFQKVAFWCVSHKFAFCSSASCFLLSGFSSALIYLRNATFAWLPCSRVLSLISQSSATCCVASKEHWKLNGRRHVLRPTVSPQKAQAGALCGSPGALILGSWGWQ